MAIKLQLDVPALNRLIGGDSEVELDLRKGIVEYFVQQKLRNLLSDERVAAILRDVQKALDVVKNGVEVKTKEMVTEQLGAMVVRRDWGREIVSFTPRPEVLAELQLRAEQAVKLILATKASEIDALIDKRVQEVVAERLDRTFEERVQAEINRRIAALAGGTT
jgi:uncharacterized membrane-anchored protein YjiN (DUF445 family)